MFSFWSEPFFCCLRTFTDAFLNIHRRLFCQFCHYGIQRIQRNDWIKLLSYKELELFYHFRTLNEKSPQLLPGNFVTVVKNVLRCPSYVFRFVYSIEKCAFLCLFRILFDSASFLADFCSAGFAKLHSMCQTIFSRRNFGLRSFPSILPPFPDFTERLSVLWQKLCASLVKTALFPPAKQIEENIVLKKCINFQHFSAFKVDHSGPSVAIFESFVQF